MTQPMDDLPPLPERCAWLRHEDACGDEVGPPDALFTADQMREYAKKAVEAEREACADIAALWDLGTPEGHAIAAAIHARTSD